MRLDKSFRRIALLTTSFGLTMTCALAETTPNATGGVVTISPLGSTSVHGKLEFKAQGGTTVISGVISGLTPGSHGMHIHEVGDCSDKDGKSAGPHFNPNGGAHAGPHDGGRHAGDLGNVTADAKGNASVNITSDMLALSGANSIIGRSVIVHEKSDDLKTQPSGDSGGRIGCGVIALISSRA